MMARQKEQQPIASPHYVRMHSPSISRREERERIFEELPTATVIDVARSEHNDISQFQLVYTIEVCYKQFKWRLVKKASQVLLLHFSLKKRALLEDLQEKQEQVKDWLQSLGVGEHGGPAMGLQQHDDDDQDEGHPSPSTRRDVPSKAALSVIRPSLGRLSSISLKAMSAMQEYLNHFLGSLDIVNTREVCKFLEVSKLSFAPEYGPKLKEGYVMVRHLPEINPADQSSNCTCSCLKWLICCFSENWQKVWAVLKPGFLALLADPYDAKPLDSIIFDVLAPPDGGSDGQIFLAKLSKERNPLRFGFMVACGNRAVKVRTKRIGSARDWVASINDAGLRPPEGWCHPHRFGSFAPPRGIFADGSEAQWFVDGKAAFDAIASAIEDAKSEILIAGWWLCPELYMRRPFHAHEESKLETLLEAKAKMGLQIYLLLYKEVALALKINSMYTKRRLQSLHENIKVLRYPDHFSSGVYLWSHHEKIVIVDNQVCFLGGLDLCFGRYDTPQHRVDDFPPIIWPGKDYYNPRESEPNSWEDTMKDQVDRQKFPRMPWHDVHCALWGPACRDVARHFVQRWNYAKRNKAPNEAAIPLLLPHHHMVIPHYLTGKEIKEVLEEEESELEQVATNQELTSARSSFQDIPLLLPQEGEGHDLNISEVQTERRTVDKASTRHTISNSHHSNSPGRSNLSEMQMHDFVDEEDIAEVEKRKLLGLEMLPNGFHQEWWEYQERDGRVSTENEAGQVGPRGRCSCQILRSVGQWSAGTSKTEETSIHAAYCSLISKAEHFVYIENQFFISGFDEDDVIYNRVLQALYDRILQAHKDQRCFRVIIVLPLLPGFQGGVDDAGAATVRAIMHWQYRTISRGRCSLLQRLQDVLGPDVDNYVSFYSLRSYGKLTEGSPLVTSQIYVHSKIMIIDDRVAMIGSANINDRSLLGSRDSEVEVVIEDDEFVDSFMNCKPWKAGKFSHSLRMALWAEHLGLHEFEKNVIMDPICETTYKGIWMMRAQVNTRIYDVVFGCIPNDTIHSRVALRQAIAKQKEKVGHTTIDLGIAPDSTEQQLNGECIQLSTDGICGHLVMHPLHFMCEEDLRPVFKESEYYASAQVFH